MNRQYIYLILLLILSTSAYANECNDGFDNDGDGLTDALITRQFSPTDTQVFQSAWAIRDYLNAKKFITFIPNNGAVRSDPSSALRVCQLGLYTQVISYEESHYTSPGDNVLAYWDQNNRNFVLTPAAHYNVMLSRLVCGNRKPTCSDGRDNDGDGLIDGNDPGCVNANDMSEKPHDPTCLNIQGATEASYQCSDGIDNDGNGVYDYPGDPGCFSAEDNQEYTLPVQKAACHDGIDNDHDGLVDYPHDPGCTSWNDNDEYHQIVYPTPFPTPAPQVQCTQIHNGPTIAFLDNEARKARRQVNRLARIYNQSDRRSRVSLEITRAARREARVAYKLAWAEINAVPEISTSCVNMNGACVVSNHQVRITGYQSSLGQIGNSGEKLIAAMDRNLDNGSPKRALRIIARLRNLRAESVSLSTALPGVSVRC